MKSGQANLYCRQRRSSTATTTPWPLGWLNHARRQLHYYPDDVWRYLLAAQWMRLAQEEAFLGRCHELNDAIGERLVAARIVRDMVRLAFMMERRYIPYSKWLGTVFS